MPWLIVAEGHFSSPLQVPSGTLAVSLTHGKVSACYGAQSWGFHGTCAPHNSVGLTTSRSCRAPHRGPLALGLYPTAQYQFPSRLDLQPHTDWPSPWHHRYVSAFWASHAGDFWPHHGHAAVSPSAFAHTPHRSHWPLVYVDHTSLPLAFWFLCPASLGLAIALYSHAWFLCRQQPSTPGVCPSSSAPPLGRPLSFSASFW